MNTDASDSSSRVADFLPDHAPGWGAFGAFVGGLLVAVYLLFPAGLVERQVIRLIEARTPEQVAIKRLDYAFPLTLRTTCVVRLPARSVELPLRIRPRFRGTDVGLGVRSNRGGTTAAEYWLRSRALHVRVDRLGLERFSTVRGFLTGRLDLTRGEPREGTFQFTVTFPGMVLFSGFPGVQKRLTLNRVEGSGSLRGRRMTAEDVTIRGENVRGTARVELRWRTPFPTSRLHVKLDLRRPGPREIEQQSTVGQMMGLLGR